MLTYLREREENMSGGKALSIEGDRKSPVGFILLAQNLGQRAQQGAQTHKLGDNDLG